MNIKSIIILFSIASFFSVNGQKTSSSFKRNLLQNEKLSPFLKDAQNYRIQIIYTPIEGNKIGKTKYFQYSKDRYFYPASTVKLPAVLLSLEKINDLNLNKENSYTSKSSFPNYPSVEKKENQSIENYVKKILLVSDNDAFNRLYDFLGTDYFNNKLAEKGYLNSRINHRLSISLTPKENQTTPKIFIGDNYSENYKVSEKVYQSPEKILMGKQYIKGEETINELMDFAAKNKFDLLDQHRMLISIFFPDQIEQKAHFNLKETDLNFVKDYMSRMPRNANYDETKFPDNYGKFFVYGSQKGRIPESIKIYNKIGAAYGFLIDNAFIKDESTGNSFLLSAVIYVNKNETLNDDNYEYDSIGLPFLAELGRYLLEQTPK